MVKPRVRPNPLTCSNPFWDNGLRERFERMSWEAHAAAAAAPPGLKADAFAEVLRSHGVHKIRMERLRRDFDEQKIV